jgi:amino acid adenylation domain-containing protein
VGILLRELATLYGSFLARRPSPLAELPIQYADYARWQLAPFQEEARAAQLAYWTGKLAGVPVVALPIDHPRPPVQGDRGGHRRLVLPAPLCGTLAQLARDEGATRFMVLLAAFVALLARYTGQCDLAVGTPVANRNRAEIEGLIGCFVNTLVLRSDLSGAPGFAELLRRVGATALEAFAHQDLPFEQLVEALRPERSLDRTPLFQVLFALATPPGEMPRLPGIELASLPLETGTAKFDLSLVLLEQGESGIEADLEYCVDLFDGATIERWLDHLQRLLEAVGAGASCPVSELPLLSPGQRHQLLVEWSAAPAVATEERLIHELVEEQAARTPDAVALLAGRHLLSYRELNRRANRLARHLRRLGVGAEDRVGIATERTPELVVGLLAILKSGGAYVPLDPAYPAARLAFTLADSRVSLLLTQASTAGDFAELAAVAVRVDAEPTAAAPGSDDDLPRTAAPGSLAYLIYTSGSTGQPKGVAITHRSAAAMLRWAAEIFAPGDLAGVLASTSIAFDLSVFELFLPLSRGGTVILAANALALPSLAAATAVTLVNTVPSAIAELVRDAGLPPGVSIVNLAGEPLAQGLVQRIYESSRHVRRVLNLYGPSEATTYSTWAAVAPRDPRRPTIGRPIAGTRAYVVDAGLRLAPLGVPGELLLGGAGLARGYFDRPDLTAEAFLPDPFAAAPGERLYRTGDLARHLADGTLEFLGRRDDQIKVRGYRIEPREIEIALSRHPEVRDAVVVCSPDAAGEHRLAAYLVPAGAGLPPPADLRAFLAGSLPGFMVPAAFVGLAALPLTASGKVDRRALPAPTAARLGAGPADAPRTPLEEVLAGIWSRVLKHEAVGVGESFFDLGGNSLRAVEVISRVRRLCGVDLPLRTLFERPTVAATAAAVTAALGGGQGAERQALRPVERGAASPLSLPQQRLWWLYRLEPDSPAYNVPSALRLTGRLDVRALAASLSATVRRHEALRTSFRMEGAGALQIVGKARSQPLPLVDLGALTAARRARETSRLAAAEAQRPFALETGPLLRTIVLRQGGEAHVLLLTLHHIISDGWSLGVLVRDVTVLYRAAAAGTLPALPALPVQYADFARWQRQRLAGEVLGSQIAWWRSRLAGAPPALPLPTDFPRPARQRFRGASDAIVLPPPLAGGFKALCRGEGVTLFMGLLAGFQALLHLLTGQDDVVVGSSVANRDREEIEDLVGFFVNTLALRTDLGGRPSFRELLTRVREVTLGAWAHQDVPFEKLVEELAPQRTPGSNPIFQVLLELLVSPRRPAELPGLAIEDYPVPAPWSKFDLTLFVSDRDGTLELRLEYDADLFRAATIRRMLQDLESLLAEVVADPQVPVATLLGGQAPHHAGALAGFSEELEAM